MSYRQNYLHSKVIYIYDIYMLHVSFSMYFVLLFMPGIYICICICARHAYLIHLTKRHLNVLPHHCRGWTEYLLIHWSFCDQNIVLCLWNLYLHQLEFFSKIILISKKKILPDIWGILQRKRDFKDKKWKIGPCRKIGRIFCSTRTSVLHLSVYCILFWISSYGML